MNYRIRRIRRFWFFFFVLMIASTCYAQERIQPGDLAYLGAFRLPEASGGSDWTYSGNAAAHYPYGDPDGSADGFPGSLYAAGNDTQLSVSEITIPAPRISTTKNVDELNQARMLQPFSGVLAGLFSYMEQPRVGLGYSEDVQDAGGGKIHYCLGMHLQDTGFEPSHGWFDLNLSNPQVKGPMVFGGYTGYVTNDYVCEIPKEWANAHTPGQYLATGRAREGPWAGGGPALFAYNPGNEGRRGSTLKSITPLLLYGVQNPGTPELSGGSSQRLPDYSDSDRYRGCAWLTAGKKAAVVFVGTKALGKSWYGFANGVEWDYECGQPGHKPCPQPPDWPYDNRGYWAEDFRAQMLFYDPKDLAAVASGKMKTWQPRPYAVMDLSPYLFDPDYNKDDLIRYKRDFVNSACFDRKNGLLYIMEPVVDEDGRGVVHVFKVK